MKILNESYRTIVAESPIWDDATNTLFFVDILGKCVFKMDYETKNITKTDVGQQIGCIALCENGDLLLAMEDGIYRMNKNGKMHLAHQPIKIKGRRFNDGKTGPDGCFYVGTADFDSKGAFYRLKDGILEELFDGCTCSNGLDWSIDNKYMYYCDTPLQKIEIFDFDKKTNSLHNRRTFAEIPLSLGKPDGFSMDENDHIWLALWDGNSLVEINPAGVIETKISMPALKVSSCCFAGNDLKDIIITTSSKDDAEEYPLSGYVFAKKTKTKGKLSYRYKG